MRLRFEAGYPEFNLKVYLKAILCAPSENVPHHAIQAESSASVRQSQRTTTSHSDQTADSPKSDISTSKFSLVVNTSIADRDDSVFADCQS